MNAAIHIQPGAVVAAHGRRYTITHVLDVNAVLGRGDEPGARPERLYIRDLAPLAADALAGGADGEPSGVRAQGAPEDAAASEAGATDLALVTDEDWKEANRRFAAIRPLLAARGRTREGVAEQARVAGASVPTLYRWLDLYRREERVSALLPTKRTGGRGKSRLSEEAEAILTATIEEFYLNAQKRSPQKTCKEVERRCRIAGVEQPHPNTVRNRIAMISEKERLGRREGRRAAQERFTPTVGSFPGADYPLAVVQIDHTKIDIILVDDLTREPVGRPWLTLAIDAYSRMVAGLYVSFDPPGAMSVGLCIAHAILPKEKWLARYGITTEWAVWGTPAKLHADNAKEFRGAMVERACREYGIDTEFRRLAHPEYGGHIERLMGTFMEEVHSLPGTTFSNVAERGEYDSEARSAMTLSEFERWLATYVTGVYHQRLHKALNTSPVRRFEQGIFGTKDQPGTGLPPRFTDEDRLRLDFMPYIERTVQQYGVVIDDVYYYSDVLRRFINAPDPDDPKVNRKFIFRRDPRDISQLYFYDPEVRQYFAVPYRDTSRPAISLWEMRAAVKRLKEQGKKDINEALIFESYESMRTQEAEAVRETKSARRGRQRRAVNEQIVRPRTAEASKTDETSADDIFADIKPFDEMEEW